MSKAALFFSPRRSVGAVRPFGILVVLVVAVTVSPTAEADKAMLKERHVSNEPMVTVEHRRVPRFVDLHVDLSYQYSYHDKPFESATGQFVENRLIDAGVFGVVLPLFVPATVSTQGPTLGELTRSYSRLSERLKQSSVYLEPGASGEIGRVRTWLSLEGSAPLADDLDSVTTWVERGVRVFGLVHSSDNVLAASATGKTKQTGGLTPVGRQLVERIHRSGGIVDVSHASMRAALEVAELGRRDGVPVVATHSNAYALTPNPRNLTDEVARAIARTGGVIGVVFHSRFLRSKGQASVTDVVRHIQYLIGLVGVSHVGVGSDFEGGIMPARGLEDVSKLSTLADALRTAGLSADAVEAVLSDNALRILERETFSRAQGNGKREASEEAFAHAIRVP